MEPGLQCLQVCPNPSLHNSSAQFSPFPSLPIPSHPFRTALAESPAKDHGCQGPWLCPCDCWGCCGSCCGCCFSIAGGCCSCLWRCWYCCCNCWFWPLICDCIHLCWASIWTCPGFHCLACEIPEAFAMNGAFAGTLLTPGTFAAGSCEIPEINPWILDLLWQITRSVIGCDLRILQGWGYLTPWHSHKNGEMQGGSINLWLPLFIWI